MDLEAPAGGGYFQIFQAASLWQSPEAATGGGCWECPAVEAAEKRHVRERLIVEISGYI